MAKIFSFFSGAGFLDLGFEHEGFQVVCVNEYHGPFLRAYKHSRRELGIPPPEYGYDSRSIAVFHDQTEVRQLGSKLKEARASGLPVGFIGGPPCPDFSVGGKNRGRTGDNGKLSESYVDLICRLHPDFFLFENVKGLWKTKRHRRFYEELKHELRLAGYSLTDRLINSIEYGVPQDRERIILLGFGPKVTADLVSNGGPKAFGWLRHVKHRKEDVFRLPWPETNEFVADDPRPAPKGIVKELAVEYWFTANRVEDHPNSEHCFTPRAGLARFQTVAEGDDSRKSFKRLHRWRYSPTACYGNNEVHLHPYRARRISVAEALAIQSLPAGFSLPPEMSLSDMFKTVGNGVPYLAARNIARSVLEYLEHPYEIDTVGYHSSDRETAEQPCLQLH